ncbi:carbamoyltransferase C-terminal domain-containing protein [uncultured Paludibaculum sp.]|uniref:carbamoyltransferase C-terminal domain-containing protein n=1 Tax=uncultured Paludibaculum sp. TaxID=1765020 RepID=UPI002AAAA429|nr:carbamoyltransferase C-terminal domain-containing protein [uncultured Paludibaculum sp.]
MQTVALARPFGENNGRHHLHLELREAFPSARIVTVEHHQAHAASAYYASPFEYASVLTLDRSGDFRCGSRWRAAGNQLHLEKEISYPDSLGDLYSRVTHLLGFQPDADEHKVQWLSTAGTPDLAALFRGILVQDGVGLRVDRSWFDNDRMNGGGFSARFYMALGLDDGAEIPADMKPRIAAGLQAAIERLVVEMAGEGENLCLAGGLALNALLVAALERSGHWKNVFVQPAAGNSGTAIGAAYHAWHSVHGRDQRSPMTTLALGPCYTSEEIKKVIENCKLGFRYLLTTDEVLDAAVSQLAADKIVAWMQGRMEFGPRALGQRSILASPLNPYSTENLNVFIKHREPFRKFAASVPVELASEYFDVGRNARFLATVGKVRDGHRKTFESAVLGDGLVRVHTVDAQENPLFHKLLLAWGRKTGLPVLYNTSFNLFGDPLVCTPRDAVRSFYSSGIDALVVGNFLLEK